MYHEQLGFRYLFVSVSNSCNHLLLPFLPQTNQPHLMVCLKFALLVIIHHATPCIHKMVLLSFYAGIPTPYLDSDRNQYFIGKNTQVIPFWASVVSIALSNEFRVKTSGVFLQYRCWMLLPKMSLHTNTRKKSIL